MTRFVKFSEMRKKVEELGTALNGSKVHCKIFNIDCETSLINKDLIVRVQSGSVRKLLVKLSNRKSCDVKLHNGEGTITYDNCIYKHNHIQLSNMKLASYTC